MDDKNLESQLVQYFYTHPYKTVEDVMELVKVAKGQATQQVIPKYNPRSIDSVSSVPDEYIMDSKVTRAKIYQDETTHKEVLEYGNDN